MVRVIAKPQLGLRPHYPFCFVESECIYGLRDMFVANSVELVRIGFSPGMRTDTYIYVFCKKAFLRFGDWDSKTDIFPNISKNRMSEKVTKTAF